MSRKVFLSSTFADLIDHRAKVIEALERLGHQVERMEVFGARSSEPLAACLAEVEVADLFLGIYAHRYGFVPKEHAQSITEAEFRHAHTHNLPVLAFLVNEDHPWPPKLVDHGSAAEKLAELKAELRQRVVVDFFTTPENLGFRVATAVGKYLSETRASSAKPATSGLVPQLRNARDLAQLLSLALELVCKATETDYNQIFLVGETEYQRHLVCVAQSVATGKQSYRVASLRGLLGRSLNEAKILNVGDVHSWPGYFQAVTETDSELVVPILSQGVPVGVVNSESEAANHYGPSIVADVSAVTQALGELLPEYGWSPGQDYRALPYISSRSTAG